MLGHPSRFALTYTLGSLAKTFLQHKPLLDSLQTLVQLQEHGGACRNLFPGRGAQLP